MTPRPTPGAHPAPAARRPLPFAVTLVLYMLASLLVVSVVQATVLRVHAVSSGSMEDTLGVQDRVLSSPLPYLGGGPARGDIVIFGHGETWADATREPASDPLRAAVRTFGDLTGIGASNRIYTVKRVIGVPGDEVACCDTDGRVTVNGAPLDEPYIFQDLVFETGDCSSATGVASARCFPAIRVPEDSYLVMGDHRANSADSVVRCRGLTEAADCAVFVPRERITGKVVARAWPPGPVG